MSPVTATRSWLEGLVIGLNLCPFAQRVIDDNSLHIAVCDGDDEPEWVAELLRQLDFIWQSDENTVATSLLVFSQGLKDFEEFWDFVGLAEELLTEAGLEGHIQLASFHPEYCFEGVSPDHPGNYTNRSPYPTLHFIREQQLSAALQSFSHPEKIPEQNVQRLTEMGVPEIRKLMAKHGLTGDTPPSTH